jgi:putative holliday junction resolvase
MVQGAGQGRVLGVDFGRARIGVAVSDELRMLARPLCTLRGNRDESPLPALYELMQRHEICEVLVGWPRNMDGSEGVSAEQVRRFAVELARSGRAVVRLIDERLSSREAYQRLAAGAPGKSSARRRAAMEELDAHAAAIILQRYLDGEAATTVVAQIGDAADGTPAAK